MFNLMAPFALATIGIEGMYAVFAVVAQFISRRGNL